MSAMTPASTAPAGASDDLRARVAAHPLWYHTIDLAPGLATPGWFDVRPVVDRLPWPDVRGKRCLDVGTYDGFLAFELERRGAAEVMATDVADHESWDMTPGEQGVVPDYLAAVGGPSKHAGFMIAREALGSRVEHRVCSVYDLDPEVHGTFDVVVCGVLMLHLRDPLRALDAIRRVCSGEFMSVEEISLPLHLMHPRRPLSQLRPMVGQWAKPNVAGHRQMLADSGFVVEREIRPYAMPRGTAHPPRPRTLSQLRRGLLTRAVLGREGVPCVAMLCRPEG